MSFSAPSSHRLRKSCTGTKFNVFSSTIFKQCESCQLPQAMSRRSVTSSHIVHWVEGARVTPQLLLHRLALLWLLCVARFILVAHWGLSSSCCLYTHGCCYQFTIGPTLGTKVCHQLLLSGENSVPVYN